MAKMISLDELDSYATLYGRLTRHVPHYMGALRIQRGAWILHPTRKSARRLISILEKITKGVD